MKCACEKTAMTKNVVDIKCDVLDVTIWHVLRNLDCR